MNPRYRYIINYHSLPEQAKSELRSAISSTITNDPGDLRWILRRYEGKDYTFRAIVKGNELLSFTLYRMEGENRDQCYIDYVWGKMGGERVTFKEKYKVSPAQYLFEELVRTGVRKFTASASFERGIQMQSRLIMERVIERRKTDPNHDDRPLNFVVKPEGIHTVRGRRRILP